MYEHVPIYIQSTREQQKVGKKRFIPQHSLVLAWYSWLSATSTFLIRLKRPAKEDSLAAITSSFDTNFCTASDFTALRCTAKIKYKVENYTIHILSIVIYCLLTKILSETFYALFRAGWKVRTVSIHKFHDGRTIGPWAIAFWVTQVLAFWKKKTG